MLKEIRPAIVLLVALTLITGLAYPLAMTGIARCIFPQQAQGSLIEKDGKVDRLGADRPGLHQRQVLPRPAVGDARRPIPSDATKTVAGALQRRQFRRLQPRPDQQGADRPRQGRRRQAEGGEPERAGADRSGDHVGQRPRSRISRRKRRCSRCRASPRRATCRRISVRQLVDEHIEGRLLGLLGEPRVNVLALNLALDRRRSDSSA